MPVFLQTLDFSSSILNSTPNLNLIYPHSLALGKACAPYQLVTPVGPPDTFLESCICF